MENSTILIGIGNANRGDDAVGVLIARAARERLGDSVVVRERSGETMGLIEAWTGYGRAIVVDAMLSGADCGSIERFDAARFPLGRDSWTYSTHGMGLPEAIELSRSLGTLPETLVVFGIEGREFAPGAALSPELETALPRIVERVVAEVGGESI